MLPLWDSNPERRFPVVNVALIVANLAVFLFYELPNQDAAINQASFFPCDVTHACHSGLPWAVSWITAMFLHAGWLHILGNMLFLLIFGNNVEDAFGRLGYLAFYLGGGVAATVLQTAVTLLFGTAADARSANLGASGAIAAVLGAYIVLYPKAKIFGLVGIIPFRLPAWFFLGFWFLFQVFAGRLALVQPDKTSGSGVAFFAHVGGFIFGVVGAIVLNRTGRITRIDNRAQGRLPAWHDHPPPTGDSAPSAPAAPGKSTTTTPSDGTNAAPKSTNLTCYKCGHVQAVPLSEATFECAACGQKLRRKTQSAAGSC
jgi:membrane associated rhomboid family serine protease